MILVVPAAKVLLFDEYHNILPNKISKNFRFVTISKVLGVKYNKLSVSCVYLAVYILKCKL